MTDDEISLYFGTPGECQSCGGSTTADGGTFINWQWVPDGTRGPFPGDQRFCSELCWLEHLDMIAGLEEALGSDWCPHCGFDGHEHAETCPSLGRPIIDVPTRGRL